MLYQCWEVRMWWVADRGALYESAVNTGWPVGTGLMQVLQEAAQMRGVDLDKCHDVSAEQVGAPYELAAPVLNTSEGIDDPESSLNRFGRRP